MSLVAGFLALALISSFGIFVQGNRPYVEATVTCNANGLVTITIWNLTDLQEWGPGDQGMWNLSSKSECPPTDFDVAAQEVTYENFEASLCNSTDVVRIGNDIVYEFEIDAEVAGTTPTQTYHHQYIITCRYNGDQTITSSFTPIHEVSASDEDTENLALSLTLSPSSPGIPLGHNITATVEATHPFGVELDIHLVSCTITSTLNPTGYDLIADSCATDASGFITSYDCNDFTSNTEVFIFEAFRFATQSGSQPLEIACDVYVCLASNSSSSCIMACAGCTNLVRRRREVGNPYDNKIFRVKSDPFYVVDPEGEGSNNEEKEEEPEKGSSNSMVIGLCVGGIAAVAIVCVAVIVLMRRRTLSLPVSDTSSPGSYVNQGI